MELTVSESTYPIHFRSPDAKILGEYIQHRQSVDIVGLKRVGISNFLRFILSHPKVIPTYVDATHKHFFIPVDLNDLVERELYPFWTLTFKRIVDEAEKSKLSDDAKQKIASTFLSAIQSHDLFLMIDGIRRAIAILVEAGYLPTLFFLRFDRIKKAVTPEFFDNLQGLRDSSHQQLSFVFTSYRRLDVLSPDVLSKSDLASFSQVMYLRPLLHDDMSILYKSYQERYDLGLSNALQQELFLLVGGNVQYLQLAIIVLREKKDSPPRTSEELFHVLTHDERLMLQSEELWESLTGEEKEILVRISKGGKVGEEEKKKVPYLFETGLLKEENGGYTIFSKLFLQYIVTLAQIVAHSKELVFSKKEHLLFTTLHDHLGEIQEREEIIERVWPEYKEFGVSDWSIDRLVARVRVKLKQQESPFEIKTIRTRGYVLISKV